MCLACEEANMYYRWELLKQIAKGEMPEGVSEAELRDMGLPLPNEVELVEEADGTQVLRQKAPAAKPDTAKLGSAKLAAAKSSGAAADAFSCDSPDE